MSVQVYKNGVLVDVGGPAVESYSKTESDARYIRTGVADVPWTALTLSYATAGTVWFCCKNGIVFIQGKDLNWPSAGTSWQIKVLAYGIPTAYQPSLEVKGSVFSSYGQLNYSMCWCVNGSSNVAFWCQGGVADSGGRVFISYPLF